MNSHKFVELDSDHTKNCKFLRDRYTGLNQLPKNAIIAEVGVLGGDLSAWLLKNAEPRELHLIDIFNCSDYPGQDRFTNNENEAFVRNRFRDEVKEGKVIIKKGLSWEMLSGYPDHYFDWIYIDAAHDYKSVKKDLAEAVKKVKPEGFLIMNDYIMYDHLAGSRYGVVEATNEFCKEHNWEFFYFAFHPQLFCDVGLRKIRL